MTEVSDDWREDSLRWMGRVLTGKYAHWCPEWDFLPIDESVSEIACCSCYDDAEFDALAEVWRVKIDAYNEALFGAPGDDSGGDL